MREEKIEYSSIKLSFIVACCGVSVLFFQWFARFTLYEQNAIPENLPTGKHFVLSTLYGLHSLNAALLSGFITLCMCWALTYFNWMHVGSFPPTPLSPPSSPQSRTAIQHNQRSAQIQIPSSLGLAALTPFLIAIVTSYLVWSHIEETSN